MNNDWPTQKAIHKHRYCISCGESHCAGLVGAQPAVCEEGTDDCFYEPEIVSTVLAPADDIDSFYVVLVDDTAIRIQAWAIESDGTGWPLIIDPQRGTLVIAQAYCEDEFQRVASSLELDRENQLARAEASE